MRVTALALVVSMGFSGAACHTAGGRVSPATGPTTAPTVQPVGTASESAKTAPGAASPATVYKNTIEWSTASELDNFGFDIYRSLSPDGPFVRLNAEPVEGAGTIDEPRSYAWVDDTIDPYVTYYYYVESISMSGARERFTPVGEAGPKLPPKSREPIDRR